MTDLNELRRRAQQLQHEIDDADDEATARAAAEELHHLLNDADDIAVLPSVDDEENR